VAGIEAADRFGISAAALATFTTVQLLLYVAMQIPVGLMVDRFGARRLLLAGVGIMSVGQLGFAFATTYPEALGARVLVGTGDAMVFISVLRIVVAWFAPRQAPLMTQITGFTGQLGAVAAAVPMTYGLDHLGWTTTYLLGVGAGVALVVGLLVVVRDSPDQQQAAGTVVPLRTVVHNLRLAWAEPGTQLGLWTHFTTQFCGTVLTLLWGFPFLVRAEGLSPTAAGLLLTLLTLASMVAGPVVGQLVATRPFHRSTMVLTILAAIVLAWAAVLAWPGRAPLSLLVVMVVVVGIGGPAAMVGFDFARTFNPTDRIGSATGIVNQGGFTASLVAVVAIGLVLDWRTPGGGTAYSPDAFRWAMSVQFVLWLGGGLQIWRYRRLARSKLAATDPEAYAALRRTGPVLSRAG
jgi:MFS family permease